MDISASSITMNDQQMLRYSRHLLLPQVGPEVQARWLAGHAVVVGIGGLGSPASQFLASSGVGTLTLCDCDEVDLTNLQRQTLYAMGDVGRRKVLAAKHRLNTINPDIKIHTHDVRLDLPSLTDLVQNASVVLDCSDNYATRHAVNRACVAAKVPLVSGAVMRFDGQVSIFDTRTTTSPCYHCLFAESEVIEDVRCATMGVFAPAVGIIGALQASEALKLLGGIGESMVGRLLVMDALAARWHTIRIHKNPDCPVCGNKKN